MIEETGTVIKVEGITARVKVQKRGSCEDALQQVYATQRRRNGD